MVVAAESKAAFEEQHVPRNARTLPKALSGAARDTERNPSPSSDLVALFKQREKLEVRSLQIAAELDRGRLNRSKTATARDAPALPRLSHREDAIGLELDLIERRIARYPSRTLLDLGLKLEFFAVVQGWRLERPPRRNMSFEERLFRSIVRDLGDLEPPARLRVHKS